MKDARSMRIKEVSTNTSDDAGSIHTAIGFIDNDTARFRKISASNFLNIDKYW